MSEKNMLTVTGINELRNNDLKRELNTMLNVVNTVSSSMWEYARAVTVIIDNKMFSDDFSNQKEFAKYINLSPSSISNYVNAVHFVDSHSDDTVCVTVDGCREFHSLSELWFDYKNTCLSIGKAYMLSTLSEEQYFEFTVAFHNIVEGTLVYLLMSDREFKDIVRHYKEMNFDSEEAEEPQATEGSKVVEVEPKEAEEPQATEEHKVVEVEPKEAEIECSEKLENLRNDILSVLEKKINSGKKLTAFENKVLDYLYIEAGMVK